MWTCKTATKVPKLQIKQTTLKNIFMDNINKPNISKVILGLGTQKNLFYMTQQQLVSVQLSRVSLLDSVAVASF